MFHPIFLLDGEEYKTGSFLEGITVDKVRKEYNINIEIKF